MKENSIEIFWHGIIGIEYLEDTDNTVENKFYHS